MEKKMTNISKQNSVTTGIFNVNGNFISQSIDSKQKEALKHFYLRQS